MKRMEGKIVVITGCSSGIGKQVAIRLAEEGADLAICARTEHKLLVTKEECEKRGAKVLACVVDLTQEDQLFGFVERIKETYGRVDVLINNAISASICKPFLEQTMEDLMLPIRSGLIPTWQMMQAVTPLMKEKGGSIINLGSSSEEGLEGFEGYAAAKSAITALTRCAAYDLGHFGIRVNNVYPTAVTEKISGADGEEFTEEVRQYIINGIASGPLHIAGDPYRDIAPVFLFLASDDSRYVTGQNLLVEGGANIHR